jgi:hypothetical protein
LTCIIFDSVPPGCFMRSSRGGILDTGPTVQTRTARVRQATPSNRSNTKCSRLLAGALRHRASSFSSTFLPSLLCPLLPCFVGKGACFQPLHVRSHAVPPKDDSGGIDAQGDSKAAHAQAPKQHDVPSSTVSSSLTTDSIRGHV